MQNSALQQLKSDPAFLDRLQQAALRKLTPEELFEQKVSFVVSAMSEKGGATRKDVRELLESGLPVGR